MKYDVIIIGAGPGGIFAAYELMQQKPDMKVAVFEAGHALSKRRCPIDGDKIKSCIGCKSCSIMSGFGGAGAFSDGKYNITKKCCIYYVSESQNKKDIRQGVLFVLVFYCFFVNFGIMSSRIIPATNEINVNASHKIPAMENT